MRLSRIRVSCLFAVAALNGLAQQVIPLYPGGAPGSKEANYPERQYFSENWKAEVVTNVTKPALLVYKPAAGMSTGNAVVVCPGGGFMALSINNEGIEVAKWLAARGVTAFVLKYRVAHSGEDATQEFTTLFQDRAKFDEIIKDTVPLSISDGLAAVAFVRQHAADWNIAADHVGIIGFSAGGMITAAVGLRYSSESRPAFLAAIYPAASGLKNVPVPADAPPLFVAAATDDNLGLAPDSVVLYQHWTEAHKSAELHMYAKGGHGFGMKKQSLPSDEWIRDFGDWLEFEGWVKKQR
jgi:acetyl esterase/lipase